MVGYVIHAKPYMYVCRTTKEEERLKEEKRLRFRLRSRSLVVDVEKWETRSV